MEESIKNIEHHFAPQEMYILFAVGIACYAITVSRYPSPRLGRFARWLIDFFLVMSWVPLALHYVIIIFGLRPSMTFKRMPDALTDPKELYETSSLVAYYIHMIMVLAFLFWIFLLRRARYDERDESSEEDENARRVVIVED